MEYKASKFSKEKLLLALIIGIGCYGFSLNFQQKNQNRHATQALVNQYLKSEIYPKDKTAGPLKMEGTFLAGDPIRFTVISKKFQKKDIEVDFGNGVEQTLSESVFTYAYREQGQFELKIKQNGQVLFQTRLYITLNNQLVMN